MTQPRPFNGQDINVAAAATRAILDTLLTGAGLSFAQFVALRAMAAGGPGTRDEVAGRINGPGAEPDALRRAVDDLVAAGLVTDTGQVEPTERGRDLFERITATSVRVGDRLFEGIPAEDQVVTKRVLDLITERARAAGAELAGQAL